MTEPTLREMERADPFQPHDPGCQCWPHVSQRAAAEAATQAATAEYREAATPPALDRTTIITILDAEFPAAPGTIRQQHLSDVAAAILAALAAPEPPSDPGADPLREAAQALVDEWDAREVGDQPLGGHYLNQAEERLRAALGEEPHGQ